MHLHLHFEGLAKACALMSFFFLPLFSVFSLVSRNTTTLTFGSASPDRLPWANRIMPQQFGARQHLVATGTRRLAAWLCRNAG